MSYSNPYRAADSYCPPTNPPDMDHPDPPDLEDIDPMHYISECCGEHVSIAKNGTKICQCCGLFCCIDEDKTLDKLLEYCDE